MSLAKRILSRQAACLVGGQWISADSGQTLDVLNPATFEVIGVVPDCGRARCGLFFPGRIPREVSKPGRAGRTFRLSPGPMPWGRPG